MLDKDTVPVVLPLCTNKVDFNLNDVYEAYHNICYILYRGSIIEWECMAASGTGSLTFIDDLTAQSVKFCKLVGTSQVKPKA